MQNRISARSIRELVEASLKRTEPEPGFVPLRNPPIISANFIPSGIPIKHPVREFHDDRAYTDGAPGGFWDFDIWDIDNDAMPIGRAAFVKIDGVVLCERLSIERAYRGLGLGHRLIDIGQRLLGGVVHGAGEFRDEHEEFWCSEPSTSITWFRPIP